MSNFKYKCLLCDVVYNTNFEAAICCKKGVPSYSNTNGVEFINIETNKAIVACGENNVELNNVIK